VAKIYPSDWQSHDAKGVLGRQIETLRLFEAALPARYSVYHGAHWTRVAAGGSVFDGIDFVVVSPAGRIVLIEQKVGFLAETEHGLVKLNSEGKTSVAVTLGRAAVSLDARLAATFGAGSYGIDELLYCPDYVVRDPAISGVVPARIIDATRRDKMVAILREIAPADEKPFAAQPRLHRFFADMLELAPDTVALRERASEWVTRLAQGLATWGLAISMHPHRVRVVGTAGSGKTQLALRALERADKQGQRALYICYNRPLADHIRNIAPPSADVLTFHELCRVRVSEAGRDTDFSSKTVFSDLETSFSLLTTPPSHPYDVLIVDEGQDFQAAWLEPLFRQVSQTGAIWWLEDPLQNLYRREPFELAGFVTLHAPSNFRSPRNIVTMLHHLMPEAGFEAASPFQSSEVILTSYADTEQLKDETKRAITHALQAGFSRSDIAVVSYRGRERSELAGIEQLGPHRLKRFSGSYDLLGNPMFSEGEVLFESLYRFKGQAAPCIVLTEVDFEELDAPALGKLFVAATRASVQLFVVASQRAASLLCQRVPGLRVRDAKSAILAAHTSPDLEPS
jgi:hypothetical protein